MASNDILVKPIRYSHWPSSLHPDLEKGEKTFTGSDGILQSRNRVAPLNLVSNDHGASKDRDTTGGHNDSAYTSSMSTLPEDDKEQENQERDVATGNSRAFEAPAPKYRYVWMNLLRWEWLSVYRRLNAIVILVNVIIVVVFAAQGKLLKLRTTDMATALTANVLTAVLFRQDFIINLLFVIFGSCPQSFPLWLRRLAAKVYHFGGVHSGAGIASTIWLVFYNIALVFEYQHGQQSGKDIAVLVITGLLDVLLLAVLGTSYPKFRAMYHDTWELVHRFGGWTAIGLLWTNFGLNADINRQQNEPAEAVFKMLVTSPVFWMLLIISICLILPWLRLRKVPVKAVRQSEHAIRLHFTYDNLPLCAAPRLSESPLIEWHSFAGIPEESGKGFSVLVSAAGDWTKRIIENPPTKMWVRGLPVRGVLHMAPIFRRIVLVATGSGIGPVLSLLYARPVDCRILWCTKDPLEFYKPDVLNHVLRADPKAVIINRIKGQPMSLGERAYELLRECDGEAVFIISNPKVCFEGRSYLESRGVCVFSPIFDS